MNTAFSLHSFTQPALCADTVTDSVNFTSCSWIQGKARDTLQNADTQAATCPPIGDC